jgi:predicted transcriptional regulator
MKTLDEALQEKWPLLSDLQKESVLNLIANCLEEDDNTYIPELGTSISEYNREIDEAVAEIERGEFYTDEEVTAHLQQWMKDHTR